MTIKRTSTGWLIGLVLVITGLGLIACLYPVRPCRSCDGLKAHLIDRFALQIPPLDPRLDCPDCADRGKISLVRSWMRPKVSEPIAGILREIKYSMRTDSFAALQAVIQHDGKDPAEFICSLDPKDNRGMKPRFLSVQGKQYLILLIDYPSKLASQPVVSSVLLLTPEGKALDYVHVACGTLIADLEASALLSPAGDGAHIVIHAHPGLGTDVFSKKVPYYINRFQRVQSEDRTAQGGPVGAFEGVCRIRILNDRLDVLPNR